MLSYISGYHNVQALTFAGEIQIVAGHFGGGIRRWKIKDGQQHGPTMQTGSGILSIVVSQDGRWMVTGDWEGKVVIWNVATHDKAFVLKEHGDHVLAVDISSDCTRIAAVGGGTARIFTTTSDGSRFATTSYNQGFRIYSTHNGDILFDSGFEGSTNTLSAVVTPLAWASDGQQLFVASAGKITCFNVANFSSSAWQIHGQSGTSIVSNGIFTACSAGPSVSLWDCVSHKQIGSIITHTADVYSVALSPSGGYLACGFVGAKIAIHNLRDVLPPEYFDDGSRALRNALIRQQLHASQVSLIHASDEILKSWTQDDPTATEMLLSEEILRASSPSHYMLANRALVRARLKHVVLAMEDVEASLQVRPSPIGYIAKAVALLGQGDRGGALRTFDFAFHDCEPHNIRFLLLLKSVLVFESGSQEEAIACTEHLATRAKNDNDDEATYLCTQVLGVMYMKKGDYRCMIPLIERAKKLVPKDKQCPSLKTVSLIFGWCFNGLDIIAQQRLCETLHAEERTAEAVEVLLNIVRISDEENQGEKEIVDWITDFTKKCAMTLERVGDEGETFGSVQHDDIITEYSTALTISRLFIMQSRRQAAKGLWEDALQDANEAVKADPSYPWGYETKYIALHRAEQYDEAIDAFESMLHVIEQSHYSAVRQLRKNYISPSETKAVIDATIGRILNSCPLVVIDVATGCLCDGPERIRVFKAGTTFKKLVSSMTRELDDERILRVVESFFAYVMFSHAWQGNEPLYQDVKEAKSVWNLPDTPLNDKLRNFCKETRRLGHNWAWSDTCCIDKTTSSILNQSLTSMYKWYADSAVTIVFLAGVAHPTKLGDLTRSVWMTRAWTLQELLAPKVMFFCDSEWKPYLGDAGPNHKESPEIMQELADAIKTTHGTIVRFSPDNLSVREKLRLASTRNATVEEDVAYSLIGIFQSDIRPHYGEGADAIGHLLEETVARSGEATVLAWSGKSSSYNSCLPASISVYSQTPYNPPSLEGEEMETCITELRGKLSEREALSIHSQINSLPHARFATRRLYLPCIVFSVRRLGIQELHGGNEKLYRARVSGLGNVEFTTVDDLPLHKPHKFVFVHPWIRYIQGPSDGVAWGSDSESDTESDLGSDCDVESDEVASSSPLHAIPSPEVDDYTQALEMIARLGQPFNALLLVQQAIGEYKRVAAEREIVVSGLGTDISSKNIHAKVLEIL
ncbi:hypothetical protein EDC04DRAFT_104815 [Pisolithus marmoratus]|nr:hypothetical protein EDC04DRAFT_104815 [Pisolithus marmoratus]